MAMNTHILIAENDINLSTLLADYLQSKGYATEQTSNGKEGLEKKSESDKLIIIPKMILS